MTDITCSLALLGAVVLIGALYAAHYLRQGAARFGRIERDGGSELLGRGVMSAGYWTLQPLGKALVWLGVSANAVTFGSFALGLASAVALGTGHFGLAAILGTLSALGDALDGLVARLSGSCSDAGEVFDAAVDRYQEFAFFAGLAIYYRARVELVALVMLALLGSFMVSYATAKGEALRVEVPRGIMRRPERSVYLLVASNFTPLTVAMCSYLAWPALLGQAPMIAALTMVGVLANYSAAKRLYLMAKALGPKAPQPEASQAPAATTALAQAPAFPQTPAHRSFAHLFGRSPTVSAASTVVDLAAMVVLVELFHIDPVAATVLGAGVGAASQFLLGRQWTLRASNGRPVPQALRYLLVCSMSLLLNALGEYIFCSRLGAHYLPTRIVVATVVSFLWNVPMQRAFVFRRLSHPGV